MNDEERSKAKNERQARYQRSDKGKATRTRYNNSTKGKATIREASRRNGSSPTAKAALARRMAAHPEKARARHAVGYAIESGKLVRPNICEHCNKHVFTEASHADYDRPLDIEWLCKQCHMGKDARMAP